MRWSSENVRTYPDIWQYLKSSPGENERCKSGALESTIECWLFPGSFHESLVWEFWSLIKFLLQSVWHHPKNDVCFFHFGDFFLPGWWPLFVFVVFNQKSSKTTTPQPTVFHREAVGVAGQHRGGCPGEHWSDLWCGHFYQRFGAVGRWMDWRMEFFVHRSTMYWSWYILWFVIKLWYPKDMKYLWIMTEIYWNI